MTIYCTPFKNSTKETTGNSVDSGFPDLEAVKAAMGEATIEKPSMLIYGDGEDRVVFSRIIFCIDAHNTNA